MTKQSGCLSILQITDLHIMSTPEASLQGVNTAYYFHAILRQAFAEHRNFDLVLVTGDLAQEYCLASYRYILEGLAAYNIRCICLPGNHDDYLLMQQVLNTDLVNCQKQFFLGNWQIISLNSQILGEEGGYLSNVELTFLDDCLSRYPEYYALIAVHHHCLETNSAWMDTMIIENRDELFAIVDRHPQVKAITCGHIHQIMDIAKDNLRVLGTPSTCFQFKPESQKFALEDTAPGYRLMQLYANGRIDTEIKRLPVKLTGLQPDVYGY
ncbi:MAG: 3',5'-cyclic-AMP phosphodiesterase [Methylococcaceae bacterium]